MSTPFVLIALIALLFGASAEGADAPLPEARAAFERAERALAEGKLESAARGYTEALEKSPDYAAALNGLGSVYFRQGRREKAIAQFERATRVDPDFALAFFNLAFSARKKRDFATAAKAYERYTALAPEDPDGLFGLAESYRALGEKEKALAAYRTWAANGSLTTEQKSLAQKEIAALEKAIGPRAKESRGETASRLKETPESVTPPASVKTPVVASPASTAAEQIPNATLGAQRLAEGDRLMAQTRVREAAFAYRQAVNAHPDSTEANFKLGTALAQLGLLPQAIERWRAVLGLSAEASVEKAARENIERAEVRLVESGGDTPVQAVGPLSAGDRERARKAYEEGVERVNRRDFSGASQRLSEAIELNPTMTVAFVARGSALLGLRRYSEAATDYAFALRLSPELSAPLYGLAEAYKGLHRNREAKALYERYASSSAADVRPELQKEAKRSAERIR